jgi:hypothetical protein
MEGSTSKHSTGNREGRDGNGCSESKSSATDWDGHNRQTNTLGPLLPAIAAVLELAGAREEVKVVAAPSVLDIVTATPPADLVSTQTCHVVAAAILLNVAAALGALAREGSGPDSAADLAHH